MKDFFMARSPFPWFGGKAAAKIKNAILKRLPPHQRYVEVFGGGASILLAKKQAEVEVYNDVNRGLVNFFRVMADPDSFGKFMAKVRFLPVSRELYEEYVRTWAGIHEPVEQAVRWYFIARQSFSGEFGASWGATLNSTNGGMSQATASWCNSFQHLPDIHDRIQKVMLECLDWRDCLRKYSGPGWLAYCDPPYVTGTRRAGGYAHELQDKDHVELIRRVMDYDGCVVLSGYNSPLYAPLQAGGWKMDTVETVCSAAGRTRVSGLLGAGVSKTKQRRVECLWLNPQTQKALAQ
jgi:DNA adenine methylase